MKSKSLNRRKKLVLSRAEGLALRGNEGFTLAELVAVGLILATTSGVIAILLSSVLRATNRAKVANLVAQNGNYALSVMSDLMRNSQGMVDPVSCETPLTLSLITVREFDGSDTTFFCDTQGKTILWQTQAKTASLLDTSTVEIDTSLTTVASGACAFVCSQESSVAPPRITMQFTVKNKGTEAFLENRYSQLFKTAVFLRNKAR